jgi:hypothetical protein
MSRPGREARAPLWHSERRRRQCGPEWLYSNGEAPRDTEDGHGSSSVFLANRCQQARRFGAMGLDRIGSKEGSLGCRE